MNSRPHSLKLPSLARLYDTAGQECFSYRDLSSAFSRGVDAIILIIDVNNLETLRALNY